MDKMSCGIAYNFAKTKHEMAEEGSEDPENELSEEGSEYSEAEKTWVVE